MARNILSLPPEELEFQMFVMDELADAAAARGEDVIKLTIGITDLPAPRPVIDACQSMTMTEAVGRVSGKNRTCRAANLCRFDA